MSDTKNTLLSTSIVSLVGNLLLVAIKLVAGILGNSYALIADAIESAGDVLSSILLVVGLKYAQKPADENHPYGHGKIEPIITFVIVGIIVLSAGFIVHESINNIITPHKSPKPWTLIVLSLIILWKELSFRFMIKRSKENNSSALKAEAWHHRSDAITSVLAFFGILIAIVFGEGYEKADDWAALISAGFIFYNSYLILRPALGEVMDEHVYEDMVDLIKEKSMLVEGILATEKCFVRKAGMDYHVELHAQIDGNTSLTKAHDISHVLKDFLQKEIPELGHIVIHIEPYSN